MDLGLLDPAALRIERIDSASELIRIEPIREVTWGKAEGPLQPDVFVHLRNGGLILAACLGEEVVGFSLAFPSVYRGELVLWSHESAVLMKDRGVGTALKDGQRTLAADMGYNKIMWTYDPLVRRNAHLNLGKLGASVVEFVPDYYGPYRSDQQSRDALTDRFVVSWLVDPAEVTVLEPPEVSKTATVLAVGEMDIPASYPVDADVIRVALPEDIVAMRSSRPEVAHLWSLAFRTAFAKFGSTGFRVWLDTDESGRTEGYIVERIHHGEVVVR